jgi:hypothetical protein
MLGPALRLRLRAFRIAASRARKARSFTRPSRRLHRPSAFPDGPAAGQASRRAAAPTPVKARCATGFSQRFCRHPLSRMPSVVCALRRITPKKRGVMRLRSHPPIPLKGALARARHIMPAIMRHGAAATRRASAARGGPTVRAFAPHNRHYAKCPRVATGAATGGRSAGLFAPARPQGRDAASHPSAPKGGSPKAKATASG